LRIILCVSPQLTGVQRTWLFLLNPQTCYVVIHQQFFVFLQHGVGQFIGDGDDGAVVAAAVSGFETGAEGFGAEFLKLATGLGLVDGKFLEQRLGVELFQFLRFVGIGDVPAIGGVLQKVVVQQLF